MSLLISFKRISIVCKQGCYDHQVLTKDINMSQLLLIMLLTTFDLPRAGHDNCITRFLLLCGSSLLRSLILSCFLLDVVMHSSPFIIASYAEKCIRIKIIHYRRVKCIRFGPLINIL